MRLCVLLGLLISIALLALPVLLCQKADALIRSRRYLAAEEMLSIASRLAPWDEDILLIRARAARRRGDVAAFGKLLRSAVDAGLAQDRVELEMRMIAAEEGELEPLTQQLSANPPADSDLDATWEACVRAALQRHNLPLCQSMIAEWKEALPASPGPYFFEGRVLEHRNDLSGAEASFLEALSITPDHGPALYNLARVLESANRLEESRKFYARASSVLSEPHSALVGEARVARLAGNLDYAEQLLVKAMGRPVDSVRKMQARIGESSQIGTSAAKAELGHISLERKQWQDAIRWFASALDEDPFAWKYRYGYATALRESGDSESAKEQLKIVSGTQTAIKNCDGLIAKLQTDPGDLEARLQVGQLMLTYVSPAQGSRWLEGVLAIDPTNAVARQALVDYYSAIEEPTGEQLTRLNQHRRYLEESDD